MGPKIIQGFYRLQFRGVDSIISHNLYRSRAWLWRNRAKIQMKTQENQIQNRGKRERERWRVKDLTCPRSECGKNIHHHDRSSHHHHHHHHHIHNNRMGCTFR